MADTDKTVHIEVAYARPDEQVILDLDVPVGSTIAEGIDLSGITNRFPEIDLDDADVGIWAKAKKTTDTVQHGDRIEIYRPLKADPKEVRRRLAAEGKVMGQKG
ncbi:MAG: RnfH family protein [Gammaproteobacteria bacterium]